MLLKIIHDKPGCVFTDNSSVGEQTGEQTWSMHTVRVVGIGQMATLSGVSSWQVILYIHNHFSKLSHVRTGVWVSHRQGEILSSYKYHNLLASYPDHVGGGKSSLVSTVCACPNDSGNLLRTSLNMDKIHVVVMQRNNQTRYTACSVAAVFTRRWLPLSETQEPRVTPQGLRYNHCQFHCHCACS